MRMMMMDEMMMILMDEMMRMITIACNLLYDL